MVETAPDPLSAWLAALREALSAAVSGLDPLLVAGVAVLLVLLPLIALGFRRGSGARDREATAAAEFAEIKGRLTAMSEMTVRRQAEEARALDERVEQVSQRLSTALDGVSRRLSESLSETQRQNGDTVQRLTERVDTLAAVLRNVIAVIVWLVAVLIILSDLGVDLGPLLASAGVATVVIGFGAQQVVRDYLAGLFMLLEDQFGVGDVIDMGEATGTVESVSLRVTRLRDVEGVVWWVPNGQIERAGNETQDWARAVVDVAVARDSDIDSASAVLDEIAKRAVADPGLASRTLEPPKVLGIQQLTDTKVLLRVSVKVAKGAQDDVKRAIQTGVLYAFKEGRLVRPPVIEPSPDADG